MHCQSLEIEHGHAQNGLTIRDTQLRFSTTDRPCPVSARDFRRQMLMASQVKAALYAALPLAQKGWAQTARTTICASSPGHHKRALQQSSRARGDSSGT